MSFVNLLSELTDYNISYEALAKLCELQSCMIANIQYLTPYFNDLADK